jgi:NADPH-dependent glutamate synthase beta subunit-like oxidoreductase
MKACPANIDIPEYLKKTAEGDYSGALKSIYLSVPFPGILGYICFHPCENECKRGILDESVAICAIKRSLYEKVSKSELRKLTPGTDRGKRVAIVGAGPAGLTAAFYLTKAGHSVEIYDSASKPGGMLRYAIPEYRLPETVIDEELRALSQLGVNFIHNIELGKDIRLAELLDGRYDAVLLAIGANLSKGLEVKGADLPQVYLALDFLNSIKTGTPLFLSGRVIVIGGGNVAIDAAMSARRSGAESVGIICLEKKEEMPAHLWEIQQAKQEGISIHTCWGPAEFVAENGKLVGVKLKRCLNVFDQSGKFKPEYDEGETTFAEADFAILAIGQYVRTEALDDDIRSKICSGDKVTVLKNSMQTGIPGLFAAGDILRGQGSVVEAMAEGKKAAGEIDIFLGSKGIFNDGEFKMSKNDPYLGRDENYLNFRPIRPGQLNPIERI